MDNGLVLTADEQLLQRTHVLILVVVDNGLVLWQLLMVKLLGLSLNPCCSGQWSRTRLVSLLKVLPTVLILVVVDNGLVHYMTTHYILTNK